MKGVDPATPQDILEKVERLLQKQLALILRCPENWIEAYFPSDLLRKPRPTIECILETGLFQKLAPGEADEVAKQACAKTTDIIFDNLAFQLGQTVEAFPQALRLDLHAIRKSAASK